MRALPLVTPGFRSGTSRQEWSRGQLPVFPYDTRNRSFHTWTLNYSYPREGESTLTLYEKSRPGRRAFVPPATGVPEVPVEELLPQSAIRKDPADLPEASEPEIMRHFKTLSTKNFDLDTGFYPLGSCTMKHNPKVNERVAALPGHARLHPLQDPEYAQGALELMWNLQAALAEISGLPHVSLQPSAGATNARRPAAPFSKIVVARSRCIGVAPSEDTGMS